MKLKTIICIGILLVTTISITGCMQHEGKTEQKTEINHTDEQVNNNETPNEEKNNDTISYTKEEIWTNFCTSDKIRNNCLELTGKEINLENINFLSGNTIDLSNKNRYIIEIMVVDCYHCNKSMPHIIEYDNSEKDIPIYTCTFADDPITIKEWMDKNDFVFDMGMAEYDFVKYDLGIKYTPCFLFVENKIIKLAYIGEIKDVGFIKTLIRTTYKEQL